MKHLRIGHFHVALMAIALASFLTSCEQSATDHGHMLHVEFSYAPSPATVNTPIDLLFEADEDGTHMSLENVACEIHGIGSVALAEEEVGHYVGTHTFATAGTYDVHFSYTHEGDPFEEEFSITVTQ